MLSAVPCAACNGRWERVPVACITVESYVLQLSISILAPRVEESGVVFPEEDPVIEQQHISSCVNPNWMTGFIVASVATVACCILIHFPYPRHGLNKMTIIYIFAFLMVGHMYDPGKSNTWRCVWNCQSPRSGACTFGLCVEFLSHFNATRIFWSCWRAGASVSLKREFPGGGAGGK